MKTYSQKSVEVTRKWYILDASQTSLGRMATVAASLLIGKGKPTVTHHVDGGDYVIIINAKDLVVTGAKMDDKMYYNHSGYPSGLRERTLSTLMTRNPAEAITKAIRGMIPANKLRPGRLERLKIYADSNHPHAPQLPVEFSLKPKERKK